ncbi:hypothetical protein AA313_de0208492 [Arthrobotrys entomopaga]|nr:hypothetical protein AA313_de0208492 [Arthrobotrys entomopaga]
MAASKNYVVIRNEHAASDYCDFYLLNISTKTLQVYENFEDLVRKEQRIRVSQNSKAIKYTLKDISIEETTKTIIVVGGVGDNELALSCTHFDEEKRSLHQSKRKSIFCDKLKKMQHGFCPRINHRKKDTYLLLRTSNSIRNLGVELMYHSEDDVSVILKDLDPTMLDEKALTFGRVLASCFCYGDTIYGLGERSASRGETLNSSKVWAIWRFKEDEKTPFEVREPPELEDIGNFPLFGVTDKEFVLIFSRGVLLYEWVDYDAFKKLSPTIQNLEMRSYTYETDKSSED